MTEDTQPESTHAPRVWNRLRPGDLAVQPTRNSVTITGTRRGRSRSRRGRLRRSGEGCREPPSRTGRRSYRRGRRGFAGQRGDGSESWLDRGGQEVDRRRRCPRCRLRSRRRSSSWCCSPRSAGSMAERVTDLEDIRDRVIAELSGLPEPGIPMPETPSVLCADDLAPADTAGLDPSKIIGLRDHFLRQPDQPYGNHREAVGHPVHRTAAKELESISAGIPILIDGTTGDS